LPDQNLTTTRISFFIGQAKDRSDSSTEEWVPKKGLVGRVEAG